VLHPATFQSVTGVTLLDLAVENLEAAPLDPRLHTEWKPGWLSSAARSGGRIAVVLGDAPKARPSSMDARTASETVQQLVYTLQAVTHTHDPVRFERQGAQVRSVLGVDTTRPVGAKPLHEVMSLMNVLSQEPGDSYVGSRPYPVYGTANTADGSVTVRVERHGAVLRTVTGRLAGSGDPDRLYPWHVLIDVKGLAKGSYRLVASGPDPDDPSSTVSQTSTLVLARG
jgi:hypothetical protein